MRAKVYYLELDLLLRWKFNLIGPEHRSGASNWHLSRKSYALCKRGGKLRPACDGQILQYTFFFSYFIKGCYNCFVVAA